MAASPPHYKGNGDWSSANFPKMWEGTFFPKKEREVGKIVEEG